MSFAHIFFAVFGVIFVAELPDKTALAALVLATRHKALPVFLGTALALTVQSVVAVAAGGLLSMLPARPVHVGAGILFIVSAVVMWRRKGDADEDDKAAGHTPRPPTFWRSFGTVFGVVFIAEWGDLTQLGTAALAARYKSPLAVFCGATLALWCVAGLAVFVGNRAGKLLDPELTKRVAAVIFVLLGVALLFGIL
ncbi:MAG: putative integral rane protein [Myxococcaceae bacterium]|jgi:putative Ca2+/H+ antiporter (TMEM165/GDT1 family)|nr:putative integral rane protein [Myxococcaceae bacterium]MEA2752513.1 Ca2+/H+ antiporter, family [Myxococcales bacterium]